MKSRRVATRVATAVIVFSSPAAAQDVERTGTFREALSMESVGRVAICLTACVIAIAGSGCGDQQGGGRGATAMEVAPDSFLVSFETSAGDFSVVFYRSWSPLAVDRIYRLANDAFWDGARIYRVNDRYAQFGYSGTPALDSVWIPSTIPDEPVRESNMRGSVSFARGGPDTRSAILFINRSDNDNLDDLAWNGVIGFPPVGRVSRGMEAVDELYSGYGDEPMEWEDSIVSVGNPFLNRRYPELDSITRVRVVIDVR